MSTDLMTFAGATMGTRYAVQFPRVSAGSIAPLRADLHRAVTAVDQQMSPWVTTSLVNLFNATSVGEWIRIPKQTADVISAALTIEDKSKGAFSIAVAPQVRHFGFSARQRNGGTRPPIGAPACAAIEMEGLRIRKSQPIEIDLCGIAKGYGVDVLAETMNAHGIQDFMVSIDGELRCQGAPDVGQIWQVAIEDPNPELRKEACVLPCRDLALATSGGYRNFDVVCGVQITHTINPRTGQPLSDTSRSVVVAHQSCCMADAWATALLVMPDRDAEDIIRAEKLNALFLLNEDGQTLFRPHGNFV